MYSALKQVMQIHAMVTLFHLHDQLETTLGIRQKSTSVV